MRSKTVKLDRPEVYLDGNALTQAELDALRDRVGEELTLVEAQQRRNNKLLVEFFVIVCAVCGGATYLKLQTAAAETVPYLYWGGLIVAGFLLLGLLGIINYQYLEPVAQRSLLMYDILDDIEPVGVPKAVSDRWAKNPATAGYYVQVKSQRAFCEYEYQALEKQTNADYSYKL